MGHTPSQNVVFAAEAAQERSCCPAGEAIARRIESGLRDRGYSVSPIDNWRGCGWSMDLGICEAKLQIALASTTEPKSLMLQVGCVNDPSLIARCLGKRFIDRSDEVFEIARAIQDILESAGFTKIRWRLDGYPDDERATPKPTRPKGHTS